MNRGGFSWKRLLEISKAKTRISRMTGIPFTKAGRQRKAGKIITGDGYLIPFVLIVILSFLLSACVGKTDSQIPNISKDNASTPMPTGLAQKIVETPKKSFSKAIMAIKDYNVREMNKYLNFTGVKSFKTSKKSMIARDKKLVYAFFSKLRFKVLSVSENKNNAKIKAIISNQEIKNLVKIYFTKAFKFSFKNVFAKKSLRLSQKQVEKKIRDILLEVVSGKHNKRISATVEVKLIKYKDYWKIKANNKLADALTGGGVSYFEKLTKIFSNWGKAK